MCVYMCACVFSGNIHMNADEAKKMVSNLGGENNKGFRGITGKNGNNANIQFAIDDNGNLCYRVVYASQGI